MDIETKTELTLKEKLIKWDYRRKLVILKFTLGRGYQWCQMPTLAIIGAGVIQPYLPMFKFWQLGAIAISIFFVVGFLDRKLKLLHTEQSYGTEVNPLLMKGLFQGRDPNELDKNDEDKKNDKDDKMMNEDDEKK